MDGNVAPALASAARTQALVGIPRLAASGSNEIVAALQQAGCAIIENAAPKAVIEAAIQQLGPWFERTPNGEGLFFGRGTKRFGAVLAKAPATIDLVLAPEILAAAEQVLLGGGNADCLQLHLTQAIEIGAGEPAQLLHRDDDMFPFVKPFELMINVMWPLEPFTEENGATRLGPGSQHWPRELVVLSDDGIVDATAEPGAAIIWLGSLVHGGGANRSSLPRRGLVISYSLGWLAQAEKLLLSIPPATARRLPERLQRLLGYQVHRPNLGWVEGRDPREWLNGATSDVAAAADNLTGEQMQMLDIIMGQLGRKQ